MRSALKPRAESDRRDGLASDGTTAEGASLLLDASPDSAPLTPPQLSARVEASLLTVLRQVRQQRVAEAGEAQRQAVVAGSGKAGERQRHGRIARKPNQPRATIMTFDMLPTATPSLSAAVAACINDGISVELLVVGLAAAAGAGVDDSGIGPLGFGMLGDTAAAATDVNRLDASCRAMERSLRRSLTPAWAAATDDAGNGVDGACSDGSSAGRRQGTTAVRCQLNTAIAWMATTSTWLSRLVPTVPAVMVAPALDNSRGTAVGSGRERTEADAGLQLHLRPHAQLGAGPGAAASAVAIGLGLSGHQHPHHDPVADLADELLERHVTTPLPPPYQPPSVTSLPVAKGRGSVAKNAAAAEAAAAEAAAAEAAVEAARRLSLAGARLPLVVTPLSMIRLSTLPQQYLFGRPWEVNAGTGDANGADVDTDADDGAAGLSANDADSSTFRSCWAGIVRHLIATDSGLLVALQQSSSRSTDNIELGVSAGSGVAVDAGTGSKQTKPTTTAVPGKAFIAPGALDGIQTAAAGTASADGTLNKKQTPAPAVRPLRTCGYAIILPAEQPPPPSALAPSSSAAIAQREPVAYLYRIISREGLLFNRMPMPGPGHGVMLRQQRYHMHQVVVTPLDSFAGSAAATAAGYRRQQGYHLTGAPGGATSSASMQSQLQGLSTLIAILQPADYSPLSYTTAVHEASLHAHLHGLPRVDDARVAAAGQRYAKAMGWVTGAGASTTSTKNTAAAAGGGGAGTGRAIGASQPKPARTASADARAKATSANAGGATAKNGAADAAAATASSKPAAAPKSAAAIKSQQQRVGRARAVIDSDDEDDEGFSIDDDDDSDYDGGASDENRMTVDIRSTKGKKQPPAAGAAGARSAAADGRAAAGRFTGITTNGSSNKNGVNRPNGQQSAPMPIPPAATAAALVTAVSKRPANVNAGAIRMIPGLPPPPPPPPTMTTATLNQVLGSNRANGCVANVAAAGGATVKQLPQHFNVDTGARQATKAAAASTSASSDMAGHSGTVKHRAGSYEVDDDDDDLDGGGGDGAIAMGASNAPPSAAVARGSGTAIIGGDDDADVTMNLGQMAQQQLQQQKQPSRPAATTRAEPAPSSSSARPIAPPKSIQQPHSSSSDALDIEHDQLDADLGLDLEGLDIEDLMLVTGSQFDTSTALQAYMATHNNDDDSSGDGGGGGGDGSASLKRKASSRDTGAAAATGSLSKPAVQTSIDIDIADADEVYRAAAAAAGITADGSDDDDAAPLPKQHQQHNHQQQLAGAFGEADDLWLDGDAGVGDSAAADQDGVTASANQQARPQQNHAQRPNIGAGTLAAAAAKAAADSSTRNKSKSASAPLQLTTRPDGSRVGVVGGRRVYVAPHATLPSSGRKLGEGKATSSAASMGTATATSPAEARAPLSRAAVSMDSVDNSGDSHDKKGETSLEFDEFEP